MTLSNVDIRRELADDDSAFDVEPLDPGQIQPASIDVTLGSHWVEFDEYRRGQVLELDGVMDVTAFDVEDDRYVLEPNTVVLGHTQETITLPDDISGKVAGRSSIGRTGIIPHTAGWIDPGFSGALTLEFVNFHPNPIALRSGTRIAQIVFDRTETPASPGYGDKADAKYQGQDGATRSRIHEDTDRR